MGPNPPSVHHLRAPVSSDVIIYCGGQSASEVSAAVSDGLFVYCQASLRETLNAHINCVQEYTDTLTSPSCWNAKMFHWLSCLRTKRFGVAFGYFTRKCNVYLFQMLSNSTMLT